MGRCSCVVLLLLGLLPLVSAYNVVRRDPFRSLSETLVTKQAHACDGDILQLECPARTKISIQLVLYGRSAPSKDVCPPTSKQPRIFTSYEGFSCTIRDALRTVEELCHGEKSCSIMTSPQSFGVSKLDTCPGIRKYIEVVYKCHPTSFSSRIICGGERMAVDCTSGDGLAVFDAKFQNVGSGPVYCPLRTEYLTAAMDKSKEETAVMIKECEGSSVTPALVRKCHGSQECVITADPLQLNVPKCQNQHVSLKITFACMNKDNFLPSYISRDEEEETESLYKEVFPPDERYSESGLMDAQTTDKSKDALEEQEVTDLDNLELDNSGTASQGSQLDQNKSLSSTWEQSWWLLKIIYIIVGGGELIINFLKSDLWKLVLVLTLTTGLGVSCFLILIIVKVCGLYKGKTSKPHQGDTGDGTNHVDLDSDTVDYDINTQLYTPLPEPKIMQISPDYSVATANEVQPAPFGLSTLTRNRSKQSSKAATPALETYIGGDSVVRYSTIGRTSRAANLVRNEFDGEMAGPRSLNTSYENNHLYY